MVQAVGLALFADEAADGADVVVEGVEAGFFNHADHGGAHLVHLVGGFFAHHGAADDEVGAEGQDAFNVEVGDAADGGQRGGLGGVGAEVGAADEEVAGAEGVHDFGDGGGEGDHAGGGGGDDDGAAVVVGDGVGGRGLLLRAAAGGEEKED